MTAYTLLISASELQALDADPAQSMIFDCSFDLSNPAWGEQQYRKAHIAGAAYANLDTHLSDKGTVAPDGRLVPHADAASGGRHPLPSREKFAMWLSSTGFSNGMQAVVYDRNQSLYCGRLWWMLKWVGHDAVAILDGGLQAWQATGGAVSAGEEPARFQSNFALNPPLRKLATTRQVLDSLPTRTRTIVDARAPSRYRGEVEPMDPVAGHIPGAINREFASNVDETGRFKSAALLKKEFDQLLGNTQPDSVIHQCGSGVSAVTNLVAMEIAGFGPSALYAGSWSEWSSDPSRPVERG